MYRAIIVLLSAVLFTTVSVSARETATNNREKQIKNSAGIEDKRNIRKGLHVPEEEINSEFVEIRIKGPDGVVRVKRIPKDKIPR
ncbi:MAG: hypothetical protein LWX52_10855 [Deltaproteobacteria bacterium]|jgi:hypothetical protein|nr:hypothetical protein [Deltaproteobacteria bacterium]